MAVLHDMQGDVVKKGAGKAGHRAPNVVPLDPGPNGTTLRNKVLQTSLWVSSTLSRTVCKEDERWTAWSCTGNCLG